MSMHFFDPYIPLNLEDFNASVFLLHLISFNDSSHGVVIIYGFANYSNL